MVDSDNVTLSGRWGEIRKTCDFAFLIRAKLRIILLLERLEARVRRIVYWASYQCEVSSEESRPLPHRRDRRKKNVERETRRISTRFLSSSPPHSRLLALYPFFLSPKSQSLHTDQHPTSPARWNLEQFQFVDFCARPRNSSWTSPPQVNTSVT